MRKDKAIEVINEWRDSNKRKNIRFERFCNVIEAIGFHFKGGRGSHRVYSMGGVIEILSIQNEEGKAKPYQVTQFIDIVDKYNLMESESD